MKICEDIEKLIIPILEKINQENYGFSMNGVRFDLTDIEDKFLQNKEDNNMDIEEENDNDEID